MSAIHDALKKRPEAAASPPPSPPAAAAPPTVLVTTTQRTGYGWIWTFLLAAFAVQSAFFIRESVLHRRTEGKLQQVYLQLNDERGKSLDMVKDRATTEDRLSSLKRERDRALAEKETLAKANQQVEFDNLAKEKKLSQMTKDLHQLEMEKLQLTEEIRSLKSEPKN